MGRRFAVKTSFLSVFRSFPFSIGYLSFVAIVKVQTSPVSHAGAFGATAAANPVATVINVVA